MYSKDKLKSLAKIASQNSVIPQDIESFVLTKLNKLELKLFLRFYNLELQRKSVKVSSASELSKETINSIHDIFVEKNIENVIDPTLGGGIKLQQDDLIIDFTVKKYINDTIEELKN